MSSFFNLIFIAVTIIYTVYRWDDNIQEWCPPNEHLNEAQQSLIYRCIIAGKSWSFWLLDMCNFQIFQFPNLQISEISEFLKFLFSKITNFRIFQISKFLKKAKNEWNEKKKKKKICQWTCLLIAQRWRKNMNVMWTMACIGIHNATKPRHNDVMDLISVGRVSFPLLVLPCFPFPFPPPNPSLSLFTLY